MSDSRYIKTIDQLERELQALQLERDSLQLENIQLRREKEFLQKHFEVADPGHTIRNLQDYIKELESEIIQMEQASSLSVNTLRDVYRGDKAIYHKWLNRFEELASADGSNYLAIAAYNAFKDTYEQEIKAFEGSIINLKGAMILNDGHNKILLDDKLKQAYSRSSAILISSVNYIQHTLSISDQPLIMCCYILHDLRISEPPSFNRKHLERIGVDWFVEKYPKTPKKLITIEDWFINSEKILRLEVPANNKEMGTKDKIAEELNTSTKNVTRIMNFRDFVEKTVKNTPFGIYE